MALTLITMGAQEKREERSLTQFSLDFTCVSGNPSRPCVIFPLWLTRLWFLFLGENWAYTYILRCARCVITINRCDQNYSNFTRRLRFTGFSLCVVLSSVSHWIRLDECFLYLCYTELSCMACRLFHISFFIHFSFWWGSRSSIKRVMFLCYT